MKVVRVACSLILLDSLPVPAQRPFPGGPISNRPNNAFEEETAQVGGKGVFNYYTFVGALRCLGQTESMVGIYTRRGSVLDYVRLACAVISCDRTGCRWTQYHWGPGKGNPNGGTIANTDVCPQNYVVAGFPGGRPCSAASVP